MATVNINGTAGHSNYQNIFTVNAGIKLGNNGNMYKTLTTNSGTRMAGVNVTIGKEDTYKKIYTATKDTFSSSPSGYGTNGRATYGDGRQQLVTTWKEDYSVSKASGSLRYGTENGSIKKQFSQLSS